MRCLRILPFCLWLALVSCSTPVFRVESPDEDLRELQAQYGASVKPEVYDLMRRAERVDDSAPGEAIVYYLQAYRSAGGSKALGDLKAHAIGRAVELIHREDLWGKTVSAGGASYHLRAGGGSGRLNPAVWDSLVSACRVEALHFDRRIISPGRGAAMAAGFDWHGTREQDDRFISSFGYEIPVSVELSFVGEHSAEFSFYRSREVEGRLRGNYSVPLALAAGNEHGRIPGGFEGVTNPGKLYEAMGLYAVEPPDPDRIPLVFVHGLASTPEMWIDGTNRLMEDDLIRRNYQFYYYYYPTGLPILYSAAGLKRDLKELERLLTERGGREKARNTVLIGHSMGGLLSASMVRDYGGVWEKLVTREIDDIEMDEEVRGAYKEFLFKPPLGSIRRVIFIATPHRGSKIADSWIGRLGSSLVRVPTQLLQLNLSEVGGALTDVGRTFVGRDMRADGINRLKVNNPVLKLGLERPWVPDMTYHSIIGDRGKGDTPNSSDGVVEYFSSHLDGAASEKIVPTDHGAHTGEESFAEQKRILRLHLGR